MKRNILREINEKYNSSINNDYITLGTTSAGWYTYLSQNTLKKLIKQTKINKFSFKNYICLIKEYCNITFAEICIKSNFKESIIKDVFNGRRKASRDLVIGLCFAFELNFEESNMLLMAAGYNELYPKKERDLIIAKCIVDSKNLQETNHKLVSVNPKYKIGNYDEDEG